jgi:hypothetical protein
MQISHWDGSRWLELPRPFPKPVTLQSFAAVSPNDAWAQGDYYDLDHPGFTYQALSRWNGHTWAREGTPFAARYRTRTGPGGFGIAASGRTLALSGWQAGRPVTFDWDGKGWHRADAATLPARLPRWSLQTMPYGPPATASSPDGVAFAIQGCAALGADRPVDLLYLIWRAHRRALNWTLMPERSTLDPQLAKFYPAAASRCRKAARSWLSSPWSWRSPSSSASP